MWVLLALLAAVYGAGNPDCGSAPPLTAENMPPQKVAYINIETGNTGWSAVMKRGFDGLEAVIKAKYPTSSIEFIICNEQNCLNGVDLRTYTILMINDLSANLDNTASHLAGYDKIRDWYTTTMNKPNIICDGRYRSSLWDGRTAGFSGAVPIKIQPLRPNIRLIENYFVNLGIRGGGIFLGTDHAPGWTRGINEINERIQISQFVNNFDAQPYALEIDQLSPVMTYPIADASDFKYQDKMWLWDDSSTSDAPISQQQNGRILYPIGWHGSVGLNRPGVSTTIRGSVGFLIDIESPDCGQFFASGNQVTFKGVLGSGVKNSVNDKAWSWFSALEGKVIGTGKTFQTTTLSPGQHKITLTAVDVEGFVATATVIITVTYSSGNQECIITSRNTKEVQEYFPLQRGTGAQTPVQWYSYGSPKAQSANTLDRFESEKLSANLALYRVPSNQPNPGVYLVWVNSENTLQVSFNVAITVSGVQLSNPGAFNPTVRLTDDANDLFLTWNPQTLVGKAAFSYTASTKGFIIGPFPESTTDRWCITLAVSDIKSLSVFQNWGHVKPSSAFPNPEKLVPSQYISAETKQFQYCRAQCNCGQKDTRTQPSGSIEPVRVNQGQDGSVGQIYTKGLTCAWSIKPVAPAPVAGIILWWDSKFQVNGADAVSAFQGTETGTVLPGIDKLSGNVAPKTQLIAGPEATITFTTSNTLKTEYGFVARYTIMPGLTAVNPARGPISEPTTVVLTGTNFIDSANFRVKVKFPSGTEVLVVPTKITSTSVTVVIPVGATVGTGAISVSNEFNSGFYTPTVSFDWFDASCEGLKTCAGCTSKPGKVCAWCNVDDGKNGTGSFCMPVNGNQQCAQPNIKDVGCCTQCLGLSKCNNNGKCACNETCTCDDKHFGDKCECLQCPKFNGLICGGNGTCGCDGKCTCNKGFRGDDCSCRTCEGEPGPCSGNGECNCDGTCTCNKGWTHAFPERKVCDCSTECPTNDPAKECSGFGVCRCGACECEADRRVLPDCSCVESCSQTCNENQFCNCTGSCACKPGFSGDDCQEWNDCKYDNCEDCTVDIDCGWCDEANICEPRLNTVQCGTGEQNPRGFTLRTDVDECATKPITDADKTAEDKTQVLLAGIIGGIGSAAAALLVMAYFLRGGAEAAAAGAADFGPVGGDAFQMSGIHVPAGQEMSSGIYSGN